MSIDDLDKFEEKEMKKIMAVKNNWYDWLINYIPEPITKIVGGFKDKILFLTQTDLNRHKQTMYGRGNKLSKPKTENKKRNRKKKLNREY